MKSAKKTSPVLKCRTPAIQLKRPLPGTGTLKSAVALENEDCETLINFTDDLLWSINTDYKLITSNRSFLQNISDSAGILLKTGDDILLKDFFPADFVSFWETCYNRALAGDSFSEEIYTPAFGKRKESWTETKFNPIYNGGQVVGIACNSRNITEKKSAEEEIKQREARLTETQEIAKVGSWETDLSNLEVIWSAETYRIFEKDPSGCQSSHQGFLDFIHPDDRALVDAAFIKSVTDSSINTIEHRIITSKGNTKIVEERWRIYHDETGKPLRAAGTCRDITEHKHAEAAIQKVYKDKTTILESIDDGFFSMDNNSLVTYWNRKAEIMLGEKREDIIGKNLHEVFGATGSQVFYQNYQEAIREKITIHFEAYSKRSLKWLSVSAFGSDNGLSVYFKDITEQKMATEKLKESETRYRSLIEQATDTICIADASFKFIDVNPSGCNMFGFTRSEFLQLCFTDVLFKEDLESNPIKIEELQGGKTTHSERRVKRKDGSEMHVELNSKMLEDGKIIIFGRDITERKESEKLIKESEAKYRSFFESSMDGILITVTDGEILSANPAACEIFKMTEAEICRAGRFGIADVTDPRLKVLITERLRTGKVKGEVTLLRKDGSPFEAELTSAVFTDALGQSRTSMIVRDITERKKAADKLTESELRYRSIIEQATDAICIADANMKIIDINQYGCEMLDYSREEFLRLSIVDLFVEEDLIANPFRLNELKSGKIIRSERRFRRNNGALIDVEISTKILEDGRFLVFGHDIAERKNAENNLKESEAKYRTLFEQNMAGVYQSSFNGEILNCNHAFARMLKYDSPEEILRVNASDLYFSPKDRIDFTDNVINQKNLNNYESVLKCKDGSPLYFIENISLRKNDKTGEAFFDGIMIDITEKKEAELQLKESNERYNLVSKATNDMVWDWDLVTGKVFRNKEGWKKIFRTGDQIFESDLIQDWDDRIHPDDVEKVKQVEREIQNSTREYFEVECRVMRDDGTYAYIHDRGNIFRNEAGVATRLIGATQDITQRKEAELKVAKSEIRFRSLVQNGSDLIGILDNRGYYLYSSPAVNRILGYEPEFMIGKNSFSFIHPDDISYIKNHLSKKEPNNHLSSFAFRFKNAQGEWRWLESKVTDMSNDPEVMGYIFNSRDITERKTAEAEIHKLSIIARETVNAVIITDPEGKIVWINEAFTKITEYEPGEVYGKKPGDLLQGEETSQAVVRFMRQEIKKIKAFECDIINYSKTGRKYWLHIQCQPQFDENGKLKNFFALQTDITKEKEAEVILMASEERYRYLFNNNPASIIIWDIETFEILEINETAVAMYGYCRKAFLAKTVLDLRLPEYHGKLKQFAAQARKKSDFISVNTWKHINKSGEGMYMNIASHRIEFKGRPVILSLATNITEKVILENELENERLEKQKEITDAVISAQEQERQELGAELHDNINQILAGSLLYLGLAKKELHIEHPWLTETDNLISTAIDEIRKLSHSLIPPSLNESELVDALSNLMETTRKSSKLIISLQAYGFDESSLPDKLKLSIYRIVQEQFNNILKHAGAGKVIVRLTQDNEKTLLLIKDDGAGFDTSQKSRGVGLMNIKTRASLYNGEVTIISSPGHGCELRVLFN